MAFFPSRNVMEQEEIKETGKKSIDWIISIPGKIHPTAQEYVNKVWPNIGSNNNSGEG